MNPTHVGDISLIKVSSAVINGLSLRRIIVLLLLSYLLSCTSMSTFTLQTELLFGNRVIFKDKLLFFSKLNKMKEYGPNKLSVITDFDYTLSKFWIDDHRGSCCHKIMEDCGLLTDDIYAEAQFLQNKYYPLEVDPTLDMEMKTKYMIEWVELSHALLYKVGMKKIDIINAVETAFQAKKITLRHLVSDFLDLLKKQNIPTLIFSAGIADVLEAVLNKSLTTELDWNNVYVISNKCIFNGENEELNAFEEPALHVFNKKSVAYLHTPFFQRPDILNQSRTSLLLLGDSLGDGWMCVGMNYDSDAIIKVGFLNDRPERLDDYLNVFDVIILDDPGFELPIGIVNVITSLIDLPTSEEFNFNESIPIHLRSSYSSSKSSDRMLSLDEL